MALGFGLGGTDSEEHNVCTLIDSTCCSFNIWIQLRMQCHCEAGRCTNTGVVNGLIENFEMNLKVLVSKRSSIITETHLQDDSMCGTQLFKLLLSCESVVQVQPGLQLGVMVFFKTRVKLVCVSLSMGCEKRQFSSWDLFVGPV